MSHNTDQHASSVHTEHIPDARLHDVDATQRDGRRPGVRGGPAHRTAQQPLDPAGRLPNAEHGLGSAVRTGPAGAPNTHARIITQVVTFAVPIKTKLSYTNCSNIVVGIVYNSSRLCGEFVSHIRRRKIDNFPSATERCKQKTYGHSPSRRQV